MPIQIQSIHDNEEIAESLGMLWPGGWYIREVGDQIKGSTLMDNFDMHEFLIDKLGIPKEYISWGE